MNQSFMKDKKILPLVLSMSLPMVISMAVSSLYNIVDTYFVAQISEEAMTALSLVYPIQNLVTAIAVGFAIGINAAISIFLGAGYGKKADSTATQGIILNFIHGIILVVFCLSFMPLFIKIFTSNSNVISYGIAYSNIALSFSPIVTVGISFEKIFQSVGKMKVSMISMASGCIMNIILDPLFIYGIGPFPKLGIRGAALATVIGQTISLIIYIVFYIVKPINIRIDLHKFSFSKDIVKKLYAIGIPATLNMALPSLLVSALNAILSMYSQTYVLVLGIYYKLQTFLYLPANGIVQGIRPLIGYNYGANEYTRVKKIHHTAKRLIILIMIFGTVLCWSFPRQLMSLFTSTDKTIQLGVNALHIISLGFIISSVSVAASGALEGLGKGMPSLFISFVRYIIIIIPAAFLLSKIIGAEGVWYAFVITEFFTAIISSFVYKNITGNLNLKKLL